jgi:hypothetical protein
MSAIDYKFHLPDGRVETISLSFSPVDFDLLLPSTHGREAWTALEFHQCPNCPLSIADTKDCPFARALSGFVHGFDEFYSYESAVIEVTTEQRTIVGRQPLQAGMASILGLVGATSGCPHLAFFKPMARFHLPFASEEETLVRSFSMHLLAEYLRCGGAGDHVIGLSELQSHYRAVAAVNAAMAERIRAAFDKDVVVNAIIILDTFAQAAPWVLDKSLAELKPLFNEMPMKPES